jgi:PhzF family phenazine biosynthesis protein
MMRKIAGILGFSETAFVMKSDCANFKVRFFTPHEEVDFCGHATVGTYFTLLSQDHIQPGKYLQETKAGVLNAEVKEDRSIIRKYSLWARLFNEKAFRNIGIPHYCRR